MMLVIWRKIFTFVFVNLHRLMLHNICGSMEAE